MKMIQKETKIYTDVYVSVDGKEFDNKVDCEAWEKSYKGTLEASWKLIPKKEVSDSDLGIPWSSDDHECYVIKPKTLDEIVLINAYISSVCYDGSTKLTTEHIGKLVLLNFGYDRDYCSITVLADHLKSITECITKLETEMSEQTQA